ncbi:hypothetical protein [Echinicola pacifica]|nr:hypothetical protein [Echinicola pacifica]
MKKIIQQRSQQRIIVCFKTPAPFRYLPHYFENPVNFYFKADNIER